MGDDDGGLRAAVAAGEGVADLLLPVTASMAARRESSKIMTPGPGVTPRAMDMR